MGCYCVYGIGKPAGFSADSSDSKLKPQIVCALLCKSCVCASCWKCFSNLCQGLTVASTCSCMLMSRMHILQNMK